MSGYSDTVWDHLVTVTVLTSHAGVTVSEYSSFSPNLELVGFRTFETACYYNQAEKFRDRTDQN